MSDAVTPTGASFWRQDVNWYVQQQSWTQSFYQTNQGWNQRLSNSNYAGQPSGPVDASAGAPNSAAQKLTNLVDPQTEQALAESFQSTSITGGSGNVTSGYLLNLLA